MGEPRYYFVHFPIQNIISIGQRKFLNEIKQIHKYEKVTNTNIKIYTPEIEQIIFLEVKLLNEIKIDESRQ